MIETSDAARAVNPGIIKIIGIGQSLRGDDAAGLEAVRLWQETYQAKVDRPMVQAELAELPGIGLLDLFEGSAAAILVDAVISGAKPGTIHQLSEEQLEASGSGTGSAHGWGVAETLSLGCQVCPTAMPNRVIVIGIEAGQCNLGEPLSPAVQSKLHEAATIIEQIVQDELTRS